MTTRTALPKSCRKHISVRPFLAGPALALLLSALVGCGGAPTETSSAAPAPATGTATLSWSAPIHNVDGSPITSLAGYRVYVGTAPGEYQGIDVGNTTSYRFHDLIPGTTYYFAVTAVDAGGNESDFSAVVSKQIA